MKTLILSDIHSNITALEAIWAKEKDCDQVICAGDLVDWGFHPREVIAWIQDNKVLTVKGNHDGWVVKNFYYLANGLEIKNDERGWEHHNAQLLTQADADFLDSLPEAIELDIHGVKYGMRHLIHEYDELVSLHAFAQFRNEHFSQNVSRLIVGHTHRQAIRYLSNDQCWLNPGSISYRRRDDPDKMAHYITIVDEKIFLHRLDYDRSPLHQALKGLCLNEKNMRGARHIFG